MSVRTGDIASIITALSKPNQTLFAVNVSKIMSGGMEHAEGSFSSASHTTMMNLVGFAKMDIC